MHVEASLTHSRRAKGALYAQQQEDSTEWSRVNILEARPAAEGM